MSILSLDCSMGISGDMTVAALLDMGADAEKLRAVLASLPLKGYSIEIERVKKAAIDMTDFRVVLEKDNHDHDMAYLHGHDHGHDHAHAHEHSHDHAHSHDHHHDHEHMHDHGHTHHEHRGLLDIGLLIHQSTATDCAKALALRIFEILAAAEAKAHGQPLAKVHFHEVGAIDSIVDILAAAVCLDDLGVTKTYVRTLNEGFGTVRCQHGILPIPVPAVANIAKDHGLKLNFIDIEGELITPTGAAILAALDADFTQPTNATIAAVGMGAGKREYTRPSFLRAMLLKEDAANEVLTDEVVKLETHIDDTSPEVLGFVMERLLAEGALDVAYTPIFMKKNRPAVMLTVVCKEEMRSALEKIIFTETTTIGIRRSVMQRSILPRKPAQAATPWGEVDVKVCQMGKECFVYPEYESVRTVALAAGVPLARVFRAASDAKQTEKR